MSTEITEITPQEAAPAPRPRRRITDLRIYIVVGACAWWLLLAAASRLDLSALQIPWNATAKFAIFVYFPLCILFGALAVLIFPLRRRRGRVLSEVGINRPLQFLFYVCIALFAVQAVIFVPPALSGDAMNARLEWGFKYVHVATEILIRTAVLVCVGMAVHRGRITLSDMRVLLLALVYAFLVVSRGLILEILIYFIFASILNARHKLSSFRIRGKHIFWLAVVWSLFIIYGQWRQGDEFSVTEYGEMFVDSSTLAWIFGYFLVNLDNLALVIMEHFHNESVTNVFGPLLQTLQIAKFEAVDDYLYVGKFNLGTALRPFVLDFGPWLGGLGFALLWAAVLLLPNLCRFNSNRSAVLISLAYMAFIFPVTGRLEEPAYMFPLLIVIVADRWDWGTRLGRLHKRAARAASAAAS